MFNASSLTLAVFDLVAKALNTESGTAPENLIADGSSSSEDEQTAAVLLDAIIQANGGTKPPLAFSENGEKDTWIGWEQWDKATRGPDRLNRIMLYDMLDTLDLLPVQPEAEAENAAAAAAAAASVVATTP